MSNDPLITKFEKLVKDLNTIIFGDDDQDVILDSIVKPTISKWLRSIVTDLNDAIGIAAAAGAGANGWTAQLVVDGSGVTQQEINDARVVAVDSIADLLALPASARREGLQFTVASFYSRKKQGGGNFVWEAGKDKSEANGGTVIDPDNLGGFDGSSGSLLSYLTAQGSRSGVGCFVANDVIDKVSVDRFGAVGDGVADDRASIQKAIGYIESTGVIKTLTARSGNTYLLKTTTVEPVYGDTVGVYINRLNKVRVDFNDATIRLDSGITHNVDAVLSLAPNTSVDEVAFAFADVRNLVIHGGSIAKAGLKSTYTKIAYCSFKNMRIVSLDGVGFYTDGYVILVEKIRVSSAGRNGIGFHFISQFPGANTGYLVSNCTVDYAGLTGFKMSGSSGHTYCHINNCYADFIGRDGSRNTIPENIEASYAYDFTSTRGLVLTALGAEFCGKILRLNREVTVNGLHAVQCGHSNGTTALACAIHVSNYAEKTTLSGIDIQSSQSPFTNLLLVSNPNSYNENQVSILDGSIPMSQVAYTGTASSTGMPLVTSPEDLYYAGLRRGSGDVVVTGANKYNSLEYRQDHFLVQEQTFSAKTESAGIVHDILTVSDFQSRALNVYFEIYQSTDRSDLRTVVKHTGGAQAMSWGHVIRALTSDAGYTGSVPSVTFDDSSKTLKVTLPQTSSSYFIKVTVLPSVSDSGYPIAFRWSDKGSFMVI